MGIFGKSFNDIFEARNNRKLDIDDLIFYNGKPLKEAKNEVGSFWSYLFPKKEDIKSQLIDIDLKIPKIDDNFDFDGWISKLNEVDKDVKAGITSWQDYYNSVKENQRWIAEWGKEKEGQIRTQEGLIQANKNARQTAIDYNNALKQQTASAKAAQIGMKALSVAMNIGLTVAVNLLFSGIMHLVNAQQEAIEKAKEASEALKQETDTIDDYADKVVELRKKLDEGNLSLEESKNIRVELQQIQDDLIDKYGDEAEGIDLVTGSIEGQIDALYNLKKAKFDDAYQLNKEGYDAARKQIQSAYLKLTPDRILADGFGASGNKDVEELREFIRRELKSRGYVADYGGRGGVDYYVKSSDMFTLDEDLSYIYEQVKEYSKNGNKEVKDAANTTLTYISQIRRDWSNKTVTENEEMYAQWLQYSSDYSDEYLDITRKQSKLEYAIKNGTEEEIAKAREDFLASYQNALENAGKAGDTDVVNYLEKAFENTIVAAKESSKAIANSTNNTAIPAVSNLVDEYKTLADAIDKVISKQNKLTEIYKKIMTGGSFSRDEVLGYLKEFPDLIDSVMMNEDGTFTFKLDNVKVEMDKSNDDLEGQIQAEIDKATKGVNISIEDFFKSNKDYQNAYGMALSGFRSQDDADYFNNKYFAEHRGEYDKYIQDQEKSLKGLSNVLGWVNDSLISQAENVEILDERYKNATDNITQYNSSLDSIQEAISAVNAGQGLNYEQMIKLLEIDPSLSSSITERNGLYYVEIQALNDLMKARQEEQKEAIRLERKTTEVLIIETQQKIEAIGREMATSFAKRDEMWDEYILQSQLLEGYKKILDGLDEYEYDPTQNSGGGSGSGSDSSDSDDISDKLQQEIDYYDKIIQGIEAVADKRIDVIDDEIDAIDNKIDAIEKEKDTIDKEINALEKEKDALKEQNDEKQRDLDLTEAKNNLDKAKKTKAIVYQKGKGFVQVQDEKAVKDAQKKLDDVQREIKEAEIDKKIDAWNENKERLDDEKKVVENNKKAVENNKEAVEEYKKTFSDMKSNIENGIAIETAKKALKTDEKGLLSLDEKTTKNIRDGLADVVLKNDKQDNKDNPYYQNVSLGDLLKSLGATVTEEQAKAIFAESLDNMKLPQTNMQAFNSNTTNNSYVNTSSSSNRNITINPVFNIYDASDPVKIRNEIDGYFRDIAREIK